MFFPDRTLPLWPFLLGLTIAVPGIEGQENRGREDAASRLRQAIQEARQSEGKAQLASHPALGEVAAWRSKAVAAEGSPNASRRLLEETTRRLARAGYQAHDWRSGTLIGSWDGDIWTQWSTLSPEWAREIIQGDYEAMGVGIEEYGGQPVFTLLVALSTRTVEVRQARPLENLTWVRSQVLLAVNAARREHRRRPLVPDENLDQAAQAHAGDQLQRAYYAHESPEGEKVRERAEKAGALGFRIIGENIAKGLFDPEEVVRRWLESSGHRRNILHPRYRKLGVGVAFGENEKGFEVIWVQTFGG